MAKPEADRRQISVWILAEDLRRADKLVAKMAKDTRLAGVGQVTRSTVLRLAVTSGLDALEQEYK